MVKLADKTISVLVDLITGDSGTSPYRSGPQLVSFFNQFGWHDTYGPGFPSRRYYTEKRVLEANDTLKMEQIVSSAVDPRYFLDTDWKADDVVSYLNQYLVYDGYELVRDGLCYKVRSVEVLGKSGGPIKNLIFAANGPKPEIVLIDATTNDIKIVKNEEFCLVYDRPIETHGLLWMEIVDWWKGISRQNGLSEVEAGQTLYTRLESSLASPAEKALWRSYFGIFYHRLGDRFPALIPQVYLHYDPYTIRQLHGERRLVRQRMDFLLLLSSHARIVIEVDGKQHYAEGERASPKLYAEMVAEDRRLKLAHYEVFRFGGYELTMQCGIELVEEFFARLFRNYGLVEETI
jgi:hypothetical protein